MNSKLTKALGLVLVISCFYFAVYNRQPIEVAPIPSPPTIKREIVAAAIIDSINDLAKVTAQQSGIVTKIHASVGEHVKKGQLLLTLDSSLQRAQVHANTIAFNQAQTNLLLQQKSLVHAKENLARLKKIDERAINRMDLREKTYEANLSTIHLKQAKQNLRLTEINLANAKRVLQQYRIMAPKDGLILQINIHADEYANAAIPLILLGDADKVVTRISIDEREAYNFNSKAQAYLLTNSPNPIQIPLHFIELNQIIVTQERLNSRVQEALYYYDRKTYPGLIAGQQFDAHIILHG